MYYSKTKREKLCYVNTRAQAETHDLTQSSEEQKKNRKNKKNTKTLKNYMYFSNEMQKSTPYQRTILCVLILSFFYPNISIGQRKSLCQPNKC